MTIEMTIIIKGAIFSILCFNQTRNLFQENMFVTRLVWTKSDLNIQFHLASEKDNVDCQQVRIIYFTTCTFT